MHPESENPHLINPLSSIESTSPVQKTSATISLESQARFESDMESPYGQGIATSPSFASSQESVPALNLSGSLSPMSRRASLLSNASIVDSVPTTPTSHLIEEARVDNDSDTSHRYHRIHSTPYPKTRLPLQLTPHPQARVVSLPEWTRNRDPFLEAMRNLRSVSSPVRFRRPPLSPLSAEESLELSGSSQSPASAVSFPALPEQSVGSSVRSEQSSSLSIPREQFYTAPEGFFLSPPSFKSMALSLVITGPERSLPLDRPLPPIREDDSTCSVEPNSEDEVSLMLQKATVGSSGYYNRSSVTFSNTSRSSSPESVVFLSSIARIPRTFLGGRSNSQSVAEASTTQESADDPAHDFEAYDDGDGTQHAPSTQSYVHLERELPHRHTIAQSQIGTNANANEESGAPVDSSPAVPHDDSDWIFFNPPRPIPALHGPPSLPYARCPSGAEGVILDDQQELDGVVWGLSERDPKSRYLGEAKCTEASHTEQPAVSTRENRLLQAAAYQDKIDSHAASLASKARALTIGTHNPRPMSTIMEHEPDSSPNSKEKHVRFVDNANECEIRSQAHCTSAPNTTRSATPSVLEASHTADLSWILLGQLEKARQSEPKALQRTIPSLYRKDTLDQLRRFGVPFRPHGLPTPPSTVSPKFVSQFPSSDSLPAPSRAIHHANLWSLTSAYEPPISESFAQATVQEPITTVPFNRQGAIPMRTTGPAPSSLSNIKSIPLLKLRQRQHGEMDSQQNNEHSFGEVPLSAHGVHAGTVPRVNYSSVSAAKTPQAASTPHRSKNSSAITSAVEKDTPTNKNKVSPDNRRQRMASKRTQPESSAQPRSPSKENEQATVPNSNTGGRKSSSRQSGRKRNQRTRTDSLPQKASRT
ncbi:unnamed protein product [Rhizoctonia solani]|uniref:Uncharacterized protein n=1 Tax=Rhizoctonia solani TaxID=456999 RepID=A0A8H2XTC0_9AGAM|nr:unnamed protein product [Rhizoctonia solani]